MVECSALAPLKDLDNTEVVFTAKIIDADVLDPCMFTETKYNPNWPP